jgi:hypothetical protein
MDPGAKSLRPKYLRPCRNANLPFARPPAALVASPASDASDSNHPTPAPHRNAIALDYKDIIRIALAPGCEPTPEAANPMPPDSLLPIRYPTNRPWLSGIECNSIS